MNNFDKFPGIIFAANTDGLVIYCNIQASELFQKYNRNIKELNIFDSFDSHFVDTIKTLEKRDNLDVKFSVDDKVLHLLLNFNKDANKYYFSGTDFSSIVEIEEEVHTDRAVLIESSKKNTMAELTGWICHDIRNPLMVIQGSVLKLKKHIVSKAIPDLENVITLSLNRIQKSVDKIEKSVFQKYETHQKESLDLQHKTCSNLFFFVNKIVGFYDEELRIANIKIRIKCDETNEVLFNDQAASSILTSFINNSIEALSSLGGEKWIEVSVENAEKLCFCVTDSGTGIEKQFREQIFTPFYTTKLDGKHVGTGLASALQMAQALNWTVKYNEESENTSFMLIIDYK